MMLMALAAFHRFFLFKTYYLMLLYPDRYDEVTAFHLKELTLQMTMVFFIIAFRLWYKIDRSCGIRQSKKYRFHHL
jgi:hypothetical protein